MLFLWLAASSILWGILWGQAAPPTFHAGITLVRVDAQVTESDQVVAGLAQSDFLVKENGRPQPIVYFRHEEEPLDLILVLDTSGSMRQAIRMVSESAHQTLSLLRPGDRVAVTRFTIRPALEQPFTQNHQFVEDAIAAICDRPFRGGTNIHGALLHASQRFLEEKRSDRRRAILLISDGRSPSFASKVKVLHNMWEADAVLNALLVKAHGGPRAVKVPELVEQTGGELIQGNHIADDLTQLLDRIRKRYSLHYVPPEGNVGQRREVKIELTPDAKKRYPAAHIRARKGYIYRPSAE